MRHPCATLLVALAARRCRRIYPASRLGSEFMPALDEGDLLYMPTTDPSISVTKSKELLQQTDKLIKTFPEVASVHGKIGRADTATDPAPLSMIETVVQLHTDPARWRTRPVALRLQRLARLAEVAAHRTASGPSSAASRWTSSSSAGPIRTARSIRGSTRW